MIRAPMTSTDHRYTMRPVDDAGSARRFRAAGSFPYRFDPLWVPPLPGEEKETFDPRRNQVLDLIEVQRWVLLERGSPVGRIAAFAPSHRPGVGYFGFFESPDDPGASHLLLNAAERWLGARGRSECYGPIAVTPRDRIGLLVAGFDRAPVTFTPYNPPYYARLLEAAGWSPYLFLRAYGWDPSYADPRGVGSLAARAEQRSSIVVRTLRTARMPEEIALFVRLINETLAEAWHFDAIGDREAVQLARVLRPLVDPSLALVAEDEHGPCGVALAIPDANWLWQRAGGSLWPLGWARLLRYRRRIPRVRLMALGLAPRARGTSIAARLIAALHRAGLEGGYDFGEISQVYESNTLMTRVLHRMALPVVRRYAVFSRTVEGMIS